MMARPSQYTIDTFVSITGASEADAILKLEEHGGDLNAAINAHFSEGDRRNVPAPQDDFMDIDGAIDVGSQGPTVPLSSVPWRINPFSVLDPILGRNLYDNVPEFSSTAPRVSHPRDVREIPIEFKDENNQPGASGCGPTIEDVTGTASVHGSEIHGTVIIDDEDEDIHNATADHRAGPDQIKNASGDASFALHPGPSVAPSVGLSDYNDVEEEMIRAAIEASKHEAGGHPSQQFPIPNHSSGTLFQQSSPVSEDADLARAVSLSLETAVQERALRESGVPTKEGQSSDPSCIKQEEVEGLSLANGRPGLFSLKAGTSSRPGEKNFSVQEEAEDGEEQPLVRHCSRRFGTQNAEAGQVLNSPPSSPEQQDVAVHPLNNGDAFQADEWGGISSEEHDEALMLEAAMFGGVPEDAIHHFPYSSHYPPSSTTFYPRVRRPPSPTLTAQRLLREQQDDEYLAALQADREKELKVMQEAERCRLEEAAAREENHRKILEEEEFERKLAVKEASLPQEPSSDDENAVTLLVRMPDGSRHGRRFLKSDRLQLLFDFIDVGRVVKSGTYRLVQPYPRHAFTDEERQLSLSELGLTSKQEALFLELV